MVCVGECAALVVKMFRQDEMAQADSAVQNAAFALVGVVEVYFVAFDHSSPRL